MNDLRRKLFVELGDLDFTRGSDMHENIWYGHVYASTYICRYIPT
jgi:hypothetical protein